MRNSYWEETNFSFGLRDSAIGGGDRLRSQYNPNTNTTQDPAYEGAPVVSAKAAKPSYCEPFEADAQTFEEGGSRCEQSVLGEVSKCVNGHAEHQCALLVFCGASQCGVWK